MHQSTEGQLTVLIADDDAMIRLIATEALASDGFTVIEAENGRVAVETFEAQQIDLVLLDVQMPEMDGFEACAKIRASERGGRVPVLMLTALDDMSAIDTAYAAGATDFSTKPINWSILLQRIHYILRASRSVEAWLASEQQNKALLDSIPDSMLRFDLNGIIVDWRPGKEALLFEPSFDPIGKPITDVLPLEIAHRYLNYGSRALKRGTSHFEHQTGTGDRPLHVEVRLAGISGSEVLAMVRDVTEQKELASELMRSQKMDALGKLTSGISHDFGNVLTVISGFAQLISMGAAGDAKLSNQADRIIQATDHATILVRELTAFSKQEVSESRVLDINTLISKLESILTRILGNDVELTLRLHPEPLAVTVDKVSIEQVLINLAANARDAMPQGGRLTIETKQSEAGESDRGRSVQVTVADDGMGMPEETRRNVFKPFFTTKAEGTGLGLANCDRIVKESGGRIVLESKESEGTTFTIVLPSVEQGRITGVVNESSATAPAGGSETILLAEDDTLVRELVVQTLEPLGYRILATANGSQAIEVSQRQEKIDLLLTDIVMPKLSGSDLAKRIQSERPNLPVLYMSGNSGDALIRYGVAAKDVTVLRKPFTPNALAQEVRRTIDRKSLREVVDLLATGTTDNPGN